ncbi:serine-aspartate repeat-containing protein C-like [Anopheles maculipalpis]|uniref:serine-aspartate repeat-containing protein C-like n=1 Tax=Anopheles maculipalpis TaxID=1496333 RepID=UPI002159A59F|nr:serine-aspartate repeat-containing protein C-like [Anopheles maculipalpis]
MGDFVNSEKISKKYYRYFLKGLAYYTCHLNKACTLTDLQAYVFLKSLQQLSEAELKFISNHVMDQLVAAGIACNQNGYFRLNELLRYAHSSTTQQAEASGNGGSREFELSSGSGLRKMVNFSNTVTMWPTDTMDANPTDSGPTMDQDVEEQPNRTEPDNNSDSDRDDEDNKAKTASNASQTNSDPGKQSDSDSGESDTITSSNVGSDDDDADDEDSTIQHKPMKQEPDTESKKSDNEDESRKQE